MYGQVGGGLGKQDKRWIVAGCFEVVASRRVGQSEKYRGLSFFFYFLIRGLLFFLRYILLTLGRRRGAPLGSPWRTLIACCRRDLPATQRQVGRDGRANNGKKSSRLIASTVVVAIITRRYERVSMLSLVVDVVVVLDVVSVNGDVVVDVVVIVDVVVVDVVPVAVIVVAVVVVVVVHLFTYSMLPFSILLFSFVTDIFLFWQSARWSLILFVFFFYSTFWLRLL